MDNKTATLPALVSLPIQSWEPIWDDAKALKEGTAFPALYKPFFITEQMIPSKAMPQSELETKLQEIQENSFVITDLLLYLDTHPDDPDADAALSSHRKIRKELLKQFAEKYYPLTPDCEGCPTKCPIPWDNPLSFSDKKGGL